MTPDQELRAAAQRLRDLDEANWRGTPLHVLFPGVIDLLEEYGEDWNLCPADHPGTHLDDAALALARKILGRGTVAGPTPVSAKPPQPAARSRDTGGELIPHGEPIDIGWTNGPLEARLDLSVREGMDPIERDHLISILREALAPVLPIRNTSAGEGRQP